MMVLTLWIVEVEIKEKPTVDVSKMLFHNQETNKIPQQNPQQFNNVPYSDITNLWNFLIKKQSD